MSKAHSGEKFRLDLRAVFYREGDYWVAHCLEMDVMGHDKDQEKAIGKMLQAVAIQVANSIEHGNHSNIFMPADAKFFEMFSVGADIAEIDCMASKAIKTIHTSDDVTVEHVEAREYLGDLALA